MVGPAGDVYAGGRTSDNVFHVSPTGVVTELLDPSGNGSGHPCDFPMRMALDPKGNLYVACHESHNVLQVSATGAVSEVVGPRGDGAASPLGAPQGIAFSNGHLYVSGYTSNNAFRVEIPQPVAVPLPWPSGFSLAALLLASGAAVTRRRP